MCRKSIITYLFAFVNSFFQNKSYTLCLSFYKIQISFCRSSFLIVGTGVLDCPKGLSCCFASLSVKFASQTFRRQPLPICTIFVVSVVGATSGRPSFIKISFCLKRTVGDACPYKICGIFDILSVGEDIILPLFIKISLRFARSPRVSLRLGRAHVLTTHCVVIHYARVATLRRPLQPKYRIARTDQFIHKKSPTR